jgi:hypothetical protein
MTEPETDRPFRGKRLTWEQFYKQHPHLRPANDNKEADPQNSEKVNLEVIK